MTPPDNHACVCWLLTCCTSGAGKTSTLVAAVRMLRAAGATLLLSAYTNSAVDNLLRKLVEGGVTDFLRLGRPSSVHPDIRGYMPGSAR